MRAGLRFKCAYPKDSNDNSLWLVRQKIFGYSFNLRERGFFFFTTVTVVAASLVLVRDWACVEIIF